MSSDWVHGRYGCRLKGFEVCSLSRRLGFAYCVVRTEKAAKLICALRGKSSHREAKY